MNRRAHLARFPLPLSPKRARWALLGFLAALAALISISVWSGNASASAQLIDFEGFSAGAVPTELTIGSGISGDPLPGTASVGLSASASGAAAGPQMIFDSNCAGGCSGGDTDLQVNSGNILIYSEDGDASDPDDCAFCSPTFTLNFAGLGPHGVSPESIRAVDVESGGSVVLHGPGGVLGSVPIPAIADGAATTVILSLFSGATSIQISLIGSGGIDNLAFTPTPPPSPPPPPPSGQIRIEKSIVSADGGTPNNPASPSLEGFEFEVANQNDVVIWTFSTNAEGRAQTLIGLPIGNYTITESDAQGLTDLTQSVAITLTTGLTTIDWVNQQPVPLAPAIDIELATSGADADLPADAVEVEFDSAVTWTMVVTNTGNTPLTNVTVTGPDAASDTALIIDGVSLDIGETATYERVGIADEGLVGKLAEVTSDEGVSDSDPSHYTGASEPDEVSPVADVVFTVDIELATNGADADLEA